MVNLFDEQTAVNYEVGYSSGYDHEFPNENIVRLERGYFKTGNGNVLDYGFGFGANSIYLAEKGYSVFGIDVAPSSIDLTQKKLEKKPLLKNKINLQIFDKENSKSLPFEDSFFDFILCNQTLYHLGSIEKINFLLDEFLRVLKPDGKIIVTLLGPKNTLCQEGTKIQENIFEYVDKTKSLKPKPMRVYVFKNEEHIETIFHKFNIDEIGWWDNNYFDINGFHYVVLCRKPSDS